MTPAAYVTMTLTHAKDFASTNTNPSRPPQVTTQTFNKNRTFKVRDKKADEAEERISEEHEDVRLRHKLR